MFVIVVKHARKGSKEPAQCNPPSDPRPFNVLSVLGSSTSSAINKHRRYRLYLPVVASDIKMATSQGGLFTNTNKCQQMPTNANKCQQMPTTVPEKKESQDKHSRETWRHDIPSRSSIFTREIFPANCRINSVAFLK